MPPRKKAKGTPRAASTPVTEEDATAIDNAAVEGSSKPGVDILKDPWTDEQETSLFKGIIKWKPAGMHKHFRMIAISEHLRNHGYDPTAEKHTRIPGIWQKLRTLYDLDIIDDRENSFEYEDPDKHVEFKLPEEGFDEAMFMRGKRSASDASSSPPSSPSRLERSTSPQPTKKRKRGDTVTTKNRASTVDDTDEPRTSPAPSPPKQTRAGRGINRSIGRAKAESSSRQPSKDTTVDDDEGAEETEEADDDEQDGDEDSTPSPKVPKTTTKSKADPPTTRKSKRKR